MPYRIVPLVTGEFYHLYNRGLGKQDIFTDRRDRNHFIKALFYYTIQNPKPKFSVYRRTKIFPVDETKKIVDIVCFCLMPNHFHLLVKQLKDGGISEFMRRFIHSYTKYRNVKYSKQGPVFQGMFKAVLVESDEQLLHLSRYIHLNPLVSNITKDLDLYEWSSYREYIDAKHKGSCSKKDILDSFKTPDKYKEFVMDQADYGTTLELIKHNTID